MGTKATDPSLTDTGPTETGRADTGRAETGRADTGRNAAGPVPKPDWRQLGVNGLHRLTAADLPGMEILYLDEVAAYLMGSGPLTGPYTVEHGTQVVSCLLRAVVNSAAYRPDPTPPVTLEIDLARASVLAGAHAFAAAGRPGLSQLVNRLVTAALGELELHADSPEEQVHSLFRFGLLAVGSGPTNLLSTAAADGIDQIYVFWDSQIAAGFVPPWRVAVSP